MQGFPNLFKAIQWAIGNYPAGTIFSQSFGVTEQTFGGAAATQTAKFDQVYKMAAAKSDTVFASSGDSGTTGTAKQHKEGTAYPFPTDGWPAASPYVAAAGGTQLQYGWMWDPTSAKVLNYTPCSDHSRDSEAVWNEAWLPAATGGGPSAIYSRPSYQDGQAGVIGGNARGVPDLSWNAAVNGGVDVYITAYRNYQRAARHVYGGTFAASPQLSGVIALADEMLPAGTTVGALNPWLYKLMDTTGTSSSSFTGSTDFRDIVPQTYGIYTLENNTLGANPDGSTPTGGVPGWPTLSGWDMTNGFGTPRVAQFITDLDNLITS